MDGSPLAAAQSDYDGDFFAWAMEQAALLHAGRLSEIDLENIAEELESLGKSQKRELCSRLEILLLHLLKWQLQPGFRSGSWSGSISEQRRRLDRHLAENPSLKPIVSAEMVNAYGYARVKASQQTGLFEGAFPADCPWSEPDVLSEDFLPGEPADLPADQDKRAPQSREAPG